MAYEHILAEAKGAVGLITLNRPQALNALNAKLVTRAGAGGRSLRGGRRHRLPVLTGSDKAFAAGADIKEMKDKTFMDVYLQDFITVGWERVSQLPQADHRRGGRAMRSGGGCEMAMMCDFIIAADTAVVRPAGDHHRRHPRRRRHPAADARRRQGEGDGLVLTGRHDEGRRGRALRPCRPRRPARGPSRRDDEGGGEDRAQLATARDDRQGSGKPGAGRLACGRADLRAADVPRHLCHRRSEGRDERVRREAQAKLRKPLTFAASRARSPGRRLTTARRRR